MNDDNREVIERIRATKLRQKKIAEQHAKNPHPKGSLKHTRFEIRRKKLSVRSQRARK